MDYRSSRTSYRQEGSRYSLTVDHWSDSGGGAVEVQVWDDAHAPECIWRGSIPELGEIVVEWVERNTPPEKDSEATVGPIRDKGNPYETGVPY